MAEPMPAAARNVLPQVGAIVEAHGAFDAAGNFAEFAREHPFEVRFIEFMDVGATNGWRMDEVLPSAELRDRIAAAYPIHPLSAAQPGETAERWGYDDGLGEIGFISSVTQAFCGDCNRLRLSTEGQLYLCLFAGQGHDLRSLLRDPAGLDDAALAASIATLWRSRRDRYSELRAALPPHQGDTPRRRVEMSYIGG